MPVTKKSRHHTLDDMRKALARCEAVKEHMALLRDDDDPIAILSDTIEEVLVARQTLIELKQTMSSFLERLTRRP